jgi:hypothetical protein
MIDQKEEPKCIIACDPNCIFRKIVIRIEKELRWMFWFYMITGPLAVWKLVEIVHHLFK